MLLVKAAEEQWVKDTLHHCLIKKNKDEKNAYDQLNLSVNICSWNKVAEAVEVNIAMFAPTHHGRRACRVAHSPDITPHRCEEGQ